MTEQHTPVTQGTADAGTPAGGTAVVGPLTIRDLAVLGSVLIIFIASLIPLVVTPVGSFNLWNTTNLFYVGIGMVLPLATGALFLIRRFSPGTKLRLGSLSLDQFASVVAVFAVFFFFAGTATDFRVAYLVGLIGAVLFMAATTCASWIPVLAADFAGRAETPSHVIARDAVAPGKRPASPKPVAVKPIVPGAAAGQFGQKATDAAGDSAVGQAVGAAAWAGSRPAVAGHTSAGQIFTPAKDGRPSDGAGTDAAAASPVTGAAAGASAAAAGTAAGTAAGAGVTGATPATSSATPSSATPAAETSAAGSAANTANKAASATNTAEGTANTGGISASGAAHRDPAANSQRVSAQEPATTINPQLAQAPQEAEAVQPAAAQAPAAVAEAAAPAKESIAATVDPKAAAPAVIAEPFWFAVDRPQNVIDENTRQFIYKLTPGSWILALEDRGNSFLVQDGHGKTGVLLDLVGIERASDSQ